MTDKEFRRLSKSDLLDIIYELQKNEKELLERNKALEAELCSKELKISNAGSIAEAAVAVNGIFEAAQAAADQYLRQIKTEATVNADDARAEAERIVSEAEKRAEALLKAAEAQCAAMRRDAENEIEKRKSVLIKLVRLVSELIDKNRDTVSEQ